MSEGAICPRGRVCNRSLVDAIKVHHTIPYSRLHYVCRQHEVVIPKLAIADFAVIGKEIRQRGSTCDALLVILDPSGEILGHLGYFAVAIIGLRTVIQGNER